VRNIKPVVFLPPFLLMLAVVVLNFLDLETFTAVMTGAKNWVLDTFGWLVVLSAFGMLVVCVAIACSPFGRVVIGGPDAKPLLTRWQWFTIALCTYIAIGVLFWGPIEPIYYLSGPAESTGVKPNTPDAALFSISKIYLHWTCTPYAIITVVALMFAFAYYNMGQPFSLGATLSPLLPSRGGGTTGQVIDAVCLYTLATGMAASLGGALLLFSGGVHHLTSVAGKASPAMLAVIAAAIVGTFTVSAVTGLMRGIRFLSHINTIVMIGLLLLVFVLGPMRFVVGFAVEGFGRFLSHYPQEALFTGAASSDPWAKTWTMMHFSNWFAWAPISAVFLGRIAYGYTVRSFMLFNLVLPGIFTGLWMAIFAGTAIHMQLYADVGLSSILEQDGLEGAMYTFWEQFRFSQILIPVFLVTSFLSFVTAADSTTSAMSGLSSTGISPESPEPSTTIKIIWGVTIGLIAWIMISFAHLDGVRMLSTLGGLPALLLCLVVTFCLIKVALQPGRYDKVSNRSTE